MQCDPEFKIWLSSVVVAYAIDMSFTMHATNPHRRFTVQEMLKPLERALARIVTDCGPPGVVCDCVESKDCQPITSGIQMNDSSFSVYSDGVDFSLSDRDFDINANAIATRPVVKAGPSGVQQQAANATCNLGNSTLSSGSSQSQSYGMVGSGWNMSFSPNTKKALGINASGASGGQACGVNSTFDGGQACGANATFNGTASGGQACGVNSTFNGGSSLSKSGRSYNGTGGGFNLSFSPNTKRAFGINASGASGGQACGVNSTFDGGQACGANATFNGTASGGQACGVNSTFNGGSSLSKSGRSYNGTGGGFNLSFSPNTKRAFGINASGASGGQACGVNSTFDGGQACGANTTFNGAASGGQACNVNSTFDGGQTCDINATFDSGSSYNQSCDANGTFGGRVGGGGGGFNVSFSPNTTNAFDLNAEYDEDYTDDAYDEDYSENYSAGEFEASCADSGDFAVYNNNSCAASDTDFTNSGNVVNASQDVSELSMGEVNRSDILIQIDDASVNDSYRPVASKTSCLVPRAIDAQHVDGFSDIISNLSENCSTNNNDHGVDQEISNASDLADDGCKILQNSKDLEITQSELSSKSNCSNVSLRCANERVESNYRYNHQSELDDDCSTSCTVPRLSAGGRFTSSGLISGILSVDSLFRPQSSLLSMPRCIKQVIPVYNDAMMKLTNSGGNHANANQNIVNGNGGEGGSGGGTQNTKGPNSNDGGKGKKTNGASGQTNKPVGANGGGQVNNANNARSSGPSGAAGTNAVVAPASVPVENPGAVPVTTTVPANNANNNNNNNPVVNLPPGVLVTNVDNNPEPYVTPANNYESRLMNNLGNCLNSFVNLQDAICNCNNNVNLQAAEAPRICNQNQNQNQSPNMPVLDNSRNYEEFIQLLSEQVTSRTQTNINITKLQKLVDLLKSIGVKECAYKKILNSNENLQTKVNKLSELLNFLLNDNGNDNRCDNRNLNNNNNNNQGGNCPCSGQPQIQTRTSSRESKLVKLLNILRCLGIDTNTIDMIERFEQPIDHKIKKIKDILNRFINDLPQYTPDSDEIDVRSLRNDINELKLKLTTEIGIYEGILRRLNFSPDAINRVLNAKELVVTELINILEILTNIENEVIEPFNVATPGVFSSTQRDTSVVVAPEEVPRPAIADLAGFRAAENCEQQNIVQFLNNMGVCETDINRAVEPNVPLLERTKNLMNLVNDIAEEPCDGENANDITQAQGYVQGQIRRQLEVIRAANVNEKNYMPIVNSSLPPFTKMNKLMAIVNRLEAGESLNTTVISHSFENNLSIAGQTLKDQFHMVLDQLASIGVRTSEIDRMKNSEMPIFDKMIIGQMIIDKFTKDTQKCGAIPPQLTQASNFTQDMLNGELCRLLHLMRTLGIEQAEIDRIINSKEGVMVKIFRVLIKLKEAQPNEGFKVNSELKCQLESFERGISEEFQNLLKNLQLNGIEDQALQEIINSKLNIVDKLHYASAMYKDLLSRLPFKECDKDDSADIAKVEKKFDQLVDIFQTAGYDSKILEEMLAKDDPIAFKLLDLACFLQQNAVPAVEITPPSSEPTGHLPRTDVDQSMLYVKQSPEKKLPVHESIDVSSAPTSGDNLRNEVALASKSLHELLEKQFLQLMNAGISECVINQIINSDAMVNSKLSQITNLLKQANPQQDSSTPTACPVGTDMNKINEMVNRIIAQSQKCPTDGAKKSISPPVTSPTATCPPASASPKTICPPASTAPKAICPPASTAPKAICPPASVSPKAICPPSPTTAKAVCPPVRPKAVCPPTPATPKSVSPPALTSPKAICPPTPAKETCPSPCTPPRRQSKAQQCATANTSEYQQAEEKLQKQLFLLFDIIKETYDNPSELMDIMKSDCPTIVKVQKMFSIFKNFSHNYVCSKSGQSEPATDAEKLEKIICTLSNSPKVSNKKCLNHLLAINKTNEFKMKWLFEFIKKYAEDCATRNDDTKLKELINILMISGVNAKTLNGELSKCKSLEEQYDHVYKIIDEIWKTFNECGIKPDMTEESVVKLFGLVLYYNVDKEDVQRSLNCLQTPQQKYLFLMTLLDTLSQQHNDINFGSESPKTPSPSSSVQPRVTSPCPSPVEQPRSSAPMPVSYPTVDSFCPTDNFSTENNCLPENKNDVSDALSIAEEVLTNPNSSDVEKIDQLIDVAGCYGIDKEVLHKSIDKMPSLNQKFDYVINILELVNQMPEEDPVCVEILNCNISKLNELPNNLYSLAPVSSSNYCPPSAPKKSVQLPPDSCYGSPNLQNSPYGRNEARNVWDQQMPPYTNPMANYYSAYPTMGAHTGAIRKQPCAQRSATSRSSSNEQSSKQGLYKN